MKILITISLLLISCLSYSQQIIFRSDLAGQTLYSVQDKQKVENYLVSKIETGSVTTLMITSDHGEQYQINSYWFNNTKQLQVIDLSTTPKKLEERELKPAQILLVNEYFRYRPRSQKERKKPRQ